MEGHKSSTSDVPASPGSGELRETEAHFHRLFETMSQGVIYHDAEGRIIDANAAALNMLGVSLEEIRNRTPYDPRWRAICADSTELPPDSHPALVALRTGVPDSREMGIYNPSEESYRWLKVCAVPYFRPGDTTPGEVHTTLDDAPERRRLEAERDRLYQELEAALADLKVLGGFIPICASCKKIRNDSGYWQQLEVYVRDHSEAEFSHGVCPECFAKLYPDFVEGKD